MSLLSCLVVWRRSASWDAFKNTSIPSWYDRTIRHWLWGQNDTPSRHFDSLWTKATLISNGKRIYTRRHEFVHVYLNYLSLHFLFFNLLQAFCLENKASNKLVYAGVLEFSNPTPNTAFLPQWMFDHLSVGEGKGPHAALMTAASM